MRIGVFICQCGPNLGDALELQELVGFADGLPHVAWAASENLLCAESGREIISCAIAQHRLDRVVIAGCSPKEHEHTFQEVVGNSGLNPHLLQMANIREQCAWVTADKSEAMEKAGALIRAAVHRVMHHEPIERIEIPCNPDVLVVGAGVAGISAALALSQKQRRVYVVEREPCIGGKVARYGSLFPHQQCAACVWEAEFDALLHSPGIEVLTCCEVVEAAGSWGNFIVKVRQRATLVDPNACIGCGLCEAACPVSAPNEYNEGLDARKAVHIPYPGSLPHVAVIDKDRCTRFRFDDDCQACRDACPFGAIHYDEQDGVRELQVGAVVLATGFDLLDTRCAPQYGYGTVKHVVTGLEFERMLSSSGPTEGKILLENGQPPKSLAIVHCVGSRSHRFKSYCSEVCCRYSLKFTHQVQQQLPETEIIELFSDLCLPGRHAQPSFDSLQEDGRATLVRMRDPGAVEITASEDRIVVAYMDSGGKDQTRLVDMVVLCPAMTGSLVAADLSEIFELRTDQDGFFQVGQPATDPVSSWRDGIFVVGCAQRPMDVASAVAQGHAAAGKILSWLVPGETIALEAGAAIVDSAFCSGCRACLEVCCYKALGVDPETRGVVINKALCRGCGMCAAVCPSGAIKIPRFTYAQLAAEIGGLTA